MKILIQSLILFTLLSCARQNTEAVSPFRQMLEDYHEGQLKLYPLNATFAGDNRYNDLFPNSISSEFLAKEQSFYQNY
ncbi:MAG: DUF885 domain-containing protein, partial [Calditrichaeota bacterium]|nr:DUF885 domain-containing protein [Calditrichota bacterium]